MNLVSFMDEITLKGKLEALLFLYGEPVKISKLADTLGINSNEIDSALGELSKELNDNNGGLGITRLDNRVQLVTKPSLNQLLSKITQEELDSGLTPASMETLAIVAYLGPCRRSLIEHIRGVNSSFILRSLLIRGLVDRKSDPERANAYVYRITFDFLRHMGVGKIEELPEYEKYREFIAAFTDATETKELEHESNN